MPSRFIDFSQPQPYVEHALRFVPPGEALDLGAGSGRNTRFFSDRGFSVTAVDDDDETILALRENNKSFKRPAMVIQADIRDWRPGHRRYAIVLCTMVLHFLENDDEVAAVLTHMQDATQEGGINVVSVYTSRNPAGLRPYLMPPGNLVGYYRKWTLLDTYEGLGRLYRSKDSGRSTRDYVQRVTAQKGGTAAGAKPANS
jgi:tellurite methyltransferase